MVCLSQASASASKSIYLRLLEGVKLHSTLTLWVGILSPEVRNGEQKAYHSWRSDERHSFELPNNHLCHAGCLCKASLFWTRVDYLPPCFAGQTIFRWLKWYIKTWSWSPATTPNSRWRQRKQLKDGRSGPLFCLGYVLFYFVPSPTFLLSAPSFYS